MFNKLQWALKVFKTKSIIILTDKEAICHIPFVDIENFDNVLTLSSQQSALIAFRDNLNDLIKEHEEQVTALAERQGVQLKDKRNGKTTKKTNPKGTPKKGKG